MIKFEEELKKNGSDMKNKTFENFAWELKDKYSS